MDKIKAKTLQLNVTTKNHLPNQELKGFTTTPWASLVPGLLTNRLYATVSALVAQGQDSQLGKQTQLVGWQIVTSYCEVMEFQQGAIWAKTLLRQSSMQVYILRR